MKFISMFIIFILFMTWDHSGIAQATMFSDDFESKTIWIQEGAPDPNGWIINPFAGKGKLAIGSNALYINKGGAIPGCGASGSEQYAFDNAPSGTEQITINSPSSNDAGLRMIYKKRSWLNTQYLTSNAIAPQLGPTLVKTLYFANGCEMEVGKIAGAASSSYEIQLGILIGNNRNLDKEIEESIQKG